LAGNQSKILKINILFKNANKQKYVKLISPTALAVGGRHPQLSKKK